MGAVEHIGIKTTRVRALSGEQLVFANSDLLSSRVQNFKRMRERRIEFTFAVPIDTPPAKLRTIPGIVRAAFEGKSIARLDRVHVITPSDYGHMIQAAYFMNTSDFNEYMDFHQDLVFGILEGLRAMKLGFAMRPLGPQTDSGSDDDDGVPALSTPESDSP